MVDETMAERLLLGVLLDEALRVVEAEELFVLDSLPDVWAFKVGVLDLSIDDDRAREKLGDEAGEGKDAHVGNPTPLHRRYLFYDTHTRV